MAVKIVMFDPLYNGYFGARARGYSLKWPIRGGWRNPSFGSEKGLRDAFYAVKKSRKRSGFVIFQVLKTAH